MYIYLVMAWQIHSRINCILILFYVCFAEAKNVIQVEEHQLAVFKFLSAESKSQTPVQSWSGLLAGRERTRGEIEVAQVGFSVVFRDRRLVLCMEEKAAS